MALLTPHDTGAGQRSQFGSLLRAILFEQRHPEHSWWPERLAAVLALGGLILAFLPGFQISTWQDPSSDFKTMYASASCFLNGQRAYNFPNIEKVFHSNHVITPTSWYAHAPTYPPFTFGMIAPLTAFSMSTAVCLWLAIATLALIFGIWSLNRSVEQDFGLPRVWRLALIVLVTISPLVSFGLFFGNVSVLAASLCIIAVTTPGTHHLRLWRALALAVSLLLKPHLALLLIVGMLAARHKEDRLVAGMASAFFLVALLCFAAWNFHLPFGMQLRDYTAMVKSEIATGCLNPRNHELLAPAAQVPSLESLLGYVVDTPWMQAVNGTMLTLAAGLLLYLSRILPYNNPATRLELLGAWSTFGLLSTYHRSHDAIVLFLLLPPLLAHLAQNARSVFAWGILLLSAALSIGSWPPHFDWIATTLASPRLAGLLVFRQSAISALLLLVLLLAHLLHVSHAGQALRKTIPPQTEPSSSLHTILAADA